MKKQKKLKINFKIVMAIIFIILLIALIFCIGDILKVLKNNGASEIEVLDSIEGYSYTLNENDNKYFEETFKNLKKELEKENLDEEEYAKLISELFVIDFFSLDSSLNKNDVGGIQFVYTNYQQDFTKYAKESIYKYVENNIYGDRKQELPIVKNVEVSSIEQDSVKYSSISDDNAYLVKLNIEYEKDLGYPNEVNLVIIHSNGKLEIAEME